MPTNTDQAQALLYDQHRHGIFAPCWLAVICCAKTQSSGNAKLAYYPAVSVVIFGLLLFF
ncbi:MAG: hypothetical protein CM15mP120_26370 [Pseudomonadota bacterium]|nr:MAG: hypothetical protein CM15mP120_26370 [Pseudomonadota bacterium]